MESNNENQTIVQDLKQFFLDGGVPEDKVDEIAKKLGVKTLEDVSFIRQANLYEKAGVTTVIAQQKLAIMAKDLANDLKKAKDQPKEVQNEPDGIDQDTSLLAKVIEEDLWLEEISQKADLLFDDVTYIAGIKATMAANLGVFTAVEKLMQLMYEYAINNAMPASKLYYDLQKIVLTRKFGMPIATVQKTNYGGVPIFATAEEMDQLVQRIKHYLAPAILRAAGQLAKWFDEARKSATATYFMHRGSERKNIPYPSTAPLYEAGKELRKNINRTLAGDGIQKSFALYAEYKAFVDVINDDGLPQAVGAIDRDSVMSMLGLDAVDSAAALSERPIIQFVMNMIKAKDYIEKNAISEIDFFNQLYTLILQIDWSILTGNSDYRNLFIASKDPLKDVDAILGTSFFSEPAETQAVAINDKSAPLSIGAQDSAASLTQMNGRRVPASSWPDTTN